ARFAWGKARKLRKNLTAVSERRIMPQLVNKSGDSSPSGFSNFHFLISTFFSVVGQTIEQRFLFRQEIVDLYLARFRLRFIGAAVGGEDCRVDRERGRRERVTRDGDVFINYERVRRTIRFQICQRQKGSMRQRPRILHYQFRRELDEIVES